MIQIPLNQVKGDLSRDLRMAEKEDIIITRHGIPAGILIGFEDPEPGGRSCCCVTRASRNVWPRHAVACATGEESVSRSCERNTTLSRRRPGQRNERLTWVSSRRLRR